MESQSSGGERPGNAALRVIEAFGGIRPAAHKLGIAVTTVQGWKERGHIPEARHALVLEAARRHGIDIGPEDLVDGAAAPAAKTAREKPGKTAGGSADGREDEAAAGTPEGKEGKKPAEPGRPAEAPAATAPAGPAGERPVPGLGRVGFAIAVAVVVFAAVVLTAPAWGPAVGLGPGGGDDARLAAIADRLEAIEGRLDALPGTDGASARALSDLADRVDILATELGKAVKRTADLGAVLAAQGDRLTAIEQAPLGDDVAALDDRVAALEEAQLAAADSAVDDQGRSLASVVIELEQRIARQEAALAKIDALAENVAALADRLAALEKGAAADRPGRTAALVLAVAQLREALRRAEPYEGELDAVRALAEGDEEVLRLLDPVAARAATGVPTLAELRARFPAMAAAVVGARAAAAKKGWIGAALARLSNAITIRRTDAGAAPDSADAALALAERRLDEGDLAGAVRALSALSGPPAEAAAAWLADARARLAAEEAVDGLQALAIAGLSGGG